jgi:predicted nuclease of restriction endonuclease-like (RecB) superfamily
VDSKAANYSQLFQQIKAQIEVAQVRVATAANQQMLLMYWQLGICILQNQHQEGWGTKIIDRLAADLDKAFPTMKGFSVRNLKYMRKFAESYSPTVLAAMVEGQSALRMDVGKHRQVVAKINKVARKGQALVYAATSPQDLDLFLLAVPSLLSWSHHIVLMDKVPDLGKRFWYMLSAIENGMSRNTLATQIDTRLFERQVSSKKISNFKQTLPAPQTDLAQYMLKDPFIFDFVQAKEKSDERDIEQQLSEHIVKFLMELGQGFAFLGRQVHFEVGGCDFYIDLLFYHMILRAYIVIELKIRDFSPEDTGKLNFYVNLVNERMKKPQDNDTIGLLLCRGKNNVVAEYALRNISQPIGVSEYQFTKAVPEKLKSQLPDIEDLEGELRESDS